jgi:hypothetical protein
MNLNMLRLQGSGGRGARPRFAPRLETLEDRTVPSVAAVFNPANATWFLHTTNAGGPADAGIFQFGARGTTPVMGDWDGDGASGIGTFSPANATWTLRNAASPGQPDAGVFQFGAKRWIPVVGDWDGNGSDSIGAFDPRTATWHLRNSLSPGAADIVFRFGRRDWVPVVGDWDADGQVGVGVFNPRTGMWQLRNSLSPGGANIVLNFGRGQVPVVGDWDGIDGDNIGSYNPKNATFRLRSDPATGEPDLLFRFGSPNLRPVVGNFLPATPSGVENPPGDPSEILTLTLPPLDLDLLGLEVQTNEIQIKITAQSGDGKLLGNLLTAVSNLINLNGVNNAVNEVLANVVSLVNSVDLSVSGIGTGAFSSSSATTTPVLDLFVAPIHLDLLGAVVDTSPIHLTIRAHSGEGLVLGNVVKALANLLNPPLPDELDLDFINSRLEQLLSDLNAQVPGIASAPTTTTPPPAGAERVLSLNLAPIDLDLLGLVLKTSQIQVNVDALTGNGKLLGNVLTTLLNTLGATPENLNELSSNLNALLGKVVGILNASSLTLPADALDSLTLALQTLALPNLVTSETTATASILDLIIASTDGSSPPVDVDLLGLKITTSNIEAQLLAETGDGKVLGNLLYNLAHLLDPGGSLNLLTILNLLGL